ncbi:MAG: ExbD/TolR family protein [Burkholderiaceae bacterium]
MGMNVGSSSSSGDPDVMVDINTTPLIDVMLVLLIMLIITIPIQLHSINLDMPVGNPPPPLVKPDVVQIDIGPEGDVRWNGETIESADALNTRLVAAATQSVQPELHVRPNKLSPYKAVAQVMAAVQRNGLTKIGLVGNEQFL